MVPPAGLTMMTPTFPKASSALPPLMTMSPGPSLSATDVGSTARASPLWRVTGLARSPASRTHKVPRMVCPAR